MTAYDQTRAWAEFAINVATEAHKNRGAETGHRDGYCLACAEIYRAVHTAKPVEKVDVHPATFDYGRYPPPPRWAIIPLTEAGVPGGGEPQPTTSTDNDRYRSTWHVHGTRPDTLVRYYSIEEGPEAELVCGGDIDPGELAALLNAVPVRSAGGGDQPDTPCNLCDDTGQYPPPGAGASTFPRPCPACTDKETPHGH